MFCVTISSLLLDACLYIYTGGQLTVLSSYNSNTANEQRSSGLLRGNKKLTNERDVYINLWHNYIVFACCVAPSSAVPHQAAQHDLR